MLWKAEIQGFSTSLKTSQTVFEKYFYEGDEEKCPFNYETQFILHLSRLGEGPLSPDPTSVSETRVDTLCCPCPLPASEPRAEAAFGLPLDTAQIAVGSGPLVSELHSSALSVGE